MQTTQSDYFSAYRSLQLTRASNGVLVVQFHTKGGPLTFTAQDHTEFVDAFYRIAQDRENKIVTLTGTAREFGARCTMKASRFSRIWRTFACRSLRLSKDRPTSIPSMR